MNDCPLVERAVGDVTCQSCMYRATSGRCLNGKADTTEFARQRGVKPADVEVERVKAEQRIQAGLMLYEYLSWARNHGRPYKGEIKAEVDQLLTATPLAEMGVTPEELLMLANPENWEHFITASRGVTPFRLAQVLLMTEQQYTLINPDDTDPAI